MCKCNSGHAAEDDSSSDRSAKSFGSYHGWGDGSMGGWRDGRGGREADEVTVRAYHWPYHRGVRGGRGGGRRRGG